MSKPVPIPKHSQWVSQILVIGALLRREIATRFGTYHLGFFWMLFEPLLSVIVLGLIIGTITSRSVKDIPYAFFLLNGLMQLNLFRAAWSCGLNAAGANQGLLVYSSVNALDPFIARFLYQLLTTVFSVIVFCVIGIWMGVELSLVNLHIVLAAYLLSWLCGCGLGLIFGVANFHNNELQKLVPVLQRPLLVISCVLTPCSTLPPIARKFLLYNPLVHTIELSRKALFPYYSIPELDLAYPAASAIVLLCLGLTLYRNNRNTLSHY